MKNPPINEIVVTASFSPQLVSLSILDMADVFGVFREEFPVFQQVQRAGVMRFDPLDQQIVEFGGATPRLMFSNTDLSEKVLLQDDRVTFQWQRTTSLFDDAGYIGFDDVLKKFSVALERFRDWVMARFGGDLAPAIGELVYTNAFPSETSDGSLRPVADFLDIGVPGEAGARVGEQYIWSERLRPPMNGHSEVLATGPAQLVDGTKVVIFRTTVAFDGSGGWDGLRDQFEQAHATASEIFDRVVKPEIRAI